MPEITVPINNRPNRGWRIRGNTATTRIHRASSPTLVTMTLDTAIEGTLVLTMTLDNVREDGSKETTAKSEYRFTPGKGRASTITELSSAFSPHEAASMPTK
jgi:hypothetical protein